MCFPDTFVLSCSSPEGVLVVEMHVSGLKVEQKCGGSIEKSAPIEVWWPDWKVCPNRRSAWVHANEQKEVPGCTQVKTEVPLVCVGAQCVRTEVPLVCRGAQCVQKEK